MWYMNPVKSIRSGAVLLAAALVSGASPAWSASPPPMAPPPPQQYDQCLALAHVKPQQAYGEAVAWRDTGGGFPARHCEAVALIEMKKYPEAAEKLEDMAAAMMRANPRLRGEVLDQAGQAWILAGKPAKATRDFDAALTFRPNDPGILIDCAEAYGLQKKFFKAIDDLNRVLNKHPHRVAALIYRASAYRQLGKLGLALNDVKRALKIDPNAVTGLLERGNIRRLQGNIVGAKTDWRRVEVLAPNTPAAQAAKYNIAHLASTTDAPKIAGARTKPALKASAR